MQKPLEMTCADFDGVTFHVFTTQGKKNELNISISTKCFETLKKYGAVQKLNAIYGKYAVEPEAGWDYTIRIDLNQLPPSAEERGTILTQ